MRSPAEATGAAIMGRTGTRWDGACGDGRPPVPGVVWRWFAGAEIYIRHGRWRIARASLRKVLSHREDAEERENVTWGWSRIPSRGPIPFTLLRRLSREPNGPPESRAETTREARTGPMPGSCSSSVTEARSISTSSTPEAAFGMAGNVRAADTAWTRGSAGFLLRDAAVWTDSTAAIWAARAAESAGLGFGALRIPLTPRTPAPRRVTAERNSRARRSAGVAMGHSEPGLGAERHREDADKDKTQRRKAAADFRGQERRGSLRVRAGYHARGKRAGNWGKGKGRSIATLSPHDRGRGPGA